MTHATEGLLQAFLDEELDSPATAGLREHLAGCVVCAAELQELQRAGDRVHRALQLAVADAPAPMLRAQAAIAAARREVEPVAARSAAARGDSRWTRLGAGGLARAAMLLLVLAGAAAAAVPGSPLRRALEATVARVSQLFTGPVERAAEPVPTAPDGTVDAAVGSRMGVLPADGRVRVLLHQPTGPVEVTVRLVDDARAHVETTMAGEDVRFRTGSGRIEVAGLAAGEVRIDIPRGVQGATIEIDGMVHVFKQAGVLQLSGPAGRGSGDQVRFRIGT
jgi:hypothetical protein